MRFPHDRPGTGLELAIHPIAPMGTRWHHGTSKAAIGVRFARALAVICLLGVALPAAGPAQAGSEPAASKDAAASVAPDGRPPSESRPRTAVRIG